MAQDFFLIRHTKPDIDSSVCYGQLDVGTASSFILEADLLKSKLPRVFDRVYSSPLIRCEQLAHYLFSAHKISVDKRLMEINFGEWENTPWNDISKAEMSFWCKDFIYHSPYGGENFIQLYDRSLQFFDEIATLNGTTAIVTHAGVIRSFLAEVLQIPLNKVFNLKLNYGAVIKLSRLDEENFSVDFL